MILDKLPSIDEFYNKYWGKKPFIVRGAIDTKLFKDFIDGDTLAGLSLEDDIKSRIVTTSSNGNEWTCKHGPFEDNKFSTLGDQNWSLLVQNVDQYHEPTATLLNSFDFSPRWLLDDIMVSYSAMGGTVGPHIDSYHVFLVQGQGRRSWRIGNTSIKNEKYIENIELKVLKDGVDGDEYEVTMGDIIYIPPNFAHEGKTIEEAMTFSVGFLGPKMSELLIDYGYYLEENETDNKRYSGEGLTAKNAGQTIANDTTSSLQNTMMNTLKADSFSKWLVQYFINRHDEI